MEVVLVYFREDGEQKDIRLPGGDVVVGRDQACKLRIPLASVSRRHCEFRREGDSLLVKDLGSSNGTFRNGRRLEPQEEEEVEAGDQLAIGSVIVTVQIDGFPEEVEPPLLEAPVGAGAGTPTDEESGDGDDTGATDSDDSGDISDLIKRAAKAVNDEDDSDVFNIDLNIDDDDED